MTELIEIEDLSANLEIVDDVVCVIEVAEQGPPGPPGVGSAWISGVGDPTATTGSLGDYYLQATTLCIFGPRSVYNAEVTYPVGSIVAGVVVWPYIACIEGTALAADIVAAINAANAPSATNAFATAADITAANAVLRFSGDLFLSDSPASAPGWEVLLTEAMNDASGEHSVVTTLQNVSYEIDRYTTAALGVTRIPAGAIEISIYTKVLAAAGTNLLEVQPCIVHVDGTYTIPAGYPLARSVDINSLDYAIIEFPTTILPAAEGILETDGFGIIVSAIRTVAGASTTVSICHDLASGCLSHVRPPITAAINATDVVTTPSGNLTSTTQAATNAELDGTKLNKVSGVSKNLQGARQPTITDAGVTSIDCSEGHVIIDGVSLNLTGGLTNVPTDNVAAFQIILRHTGGVRTLAFPAAQLEKAFTLAGTSDGFDILHLIPTGAGKFVVIVVESL